MIGAEISRACTERLICRQKLYLPFSTGTIQCCEPHKSKLLKYSSCNGGYACMADAMCSKSHRCSVWKKKTKFWVLKLPASFALEKAYVCL